MINEGDVVRLKSGGPRMTVDWVDTERGTITCSWFDGETRNQAEFGLKSVEVAKD